MTAAPRRELEEALSPRLAGRWICTWEVLPTREDGRVQRVGMATSEDLLTWERQSLLLEADPRWYETRREHPRGEETWRDPWIFWDPDGGRFHVVLRARVNHGPLDGRGVLGHAWSPDLRTWEVGPYVLDRDAFLLATPRSASTPAGPATWGGWWLLAWRHVDGGSLWLRDAPPRGPQAPAAVPVEVPPGRHGEPPARSATGAP